MWETVHGNKNYMFHENENKLYLLKLNKIKYYFMNILKLVVQETVWWTIGVTIN